MVLVDIDRIRELMQTSWLTSANRWNWAAWDDRDHLGDPSRSLRERLALDGAQRGITVPEGPVFLLTNLRYLGCGFNPVSFYYCFDTGHRLRVVAAEVHNTFGGTHVYWLPPAADGRTFRSSAPKSLYVSPFMPVDVEYRFALTPPEDRLVAHVTAARDDDRLFDATLSLERRPWSAREIRRQLLRHPAMTMRVTAGIHWQALKLWWKGVPVVPRLTPDGEGERAAWAGLVRRDGPALERRT